MHLFGRRPRVIVRSNASSRAAAASPATVGSVTPSPGALSPVSASQTWAPVNTVANQNDVHELVHRIRTLTSMGSDARLVVLEVCDRASTEPAAREAARALIHEFKHGTADAQLSAARLWAILLRNSSAAFIAQSTSGEFLEAVADLLASPHTGPVVHHRVMRVLGDAVYNNPTQEPFRRLWLRVKAPEEPERGSPYNTHDAILRPPADQYTDQHTGSTRPPATTILDRLAPPVPHQFADADTRFPPHRHESELPPPSYEAVSDSSTSGSVYSPSQTETTHMLYGSASGMDLGLDTFHARLPQPDSDPEAETWSNGVSAWSPHSFEPLRTPARQRITQSPGPPAPPPLGPRTLPPPPTTLATPALIPNRRQPLAQRQNHTNSAPAQAGPSSVTTRAADSTSTRKRKDTSLAPVQHFALQSGAAVSQRLTAPFASESALAPDNDLAGAQYRKAIYAKTLEYLKDVAWNEDSSSALIRLSSFSKGMSRLNTVELLVNALQYKELLVQISSDLGVAEHPNMRIALEDDQSAVADLLLSAAEEQVLALKDNEAQSFLDMAQYTLDHGLILHREATSRACTLIRRLARAADRLPSSLIISGVKQRSDLAVFSGGCGDVFKAMYQGRPVALKYMRRYQGTDQRETRRKLCREALVWQRLRHAFIVPLIGIDMESFPSSLCMVSPWMENGTVINFLSGFRGVTRQSVVDRLIREIAQGLAFLHDQKIVHGDLRGSNILVDDDDHASLTDFGLTVLSDATTQSQNGAGSVRWMAPEILNPDAFGLEDYKRTSASDIYAFACVCLELYTGSPPFHGAVHCNDASVMLQVMASVRPPRPAGDLIPNHIWRVMQQCWAHNHANRPSILGIVLELPVMGTLDGVVTTTVASADDTVSFSGDPGSEVQYEGWVAQVIAPLREFIIQGANPRNHFLDLQEIADGPGDATLYSARVAESEVTIGRRPSRVAIKIVPINPAGDSDSTLGDILQELRVLRHVGECEHVLRMDALYIDPVDDALWIRMELMTRTLASVIDSLNTAGLKLTEHVIAGYMKDILTALDHLRAHDVSPRDISASDMLINSDGVLKLTNLSNAINFSLPTRLVVSDSTTLGALLWEMAAGHRPPATIRNHNHWPPLSCITSRSLQFHDFFQMCFDPTVTRAGYRQLIDSPFIQDACGRPTLAQLLHQCTAIEGRLRERSRFRLEM